MQRLAGRIVAMCCFAFLLTVDEKIIPFDNCSRDGEYISLEMEKTNVLFIPPVRLTPRIFLDLALQFLLG